MTHGGSADIFAKRDDTDWDMFCRGSATSDPWSSPGASSEPQELEPARSPAGEPVPVVGTVRHFHARVVGLPYPNSDGTSRREAVAGLRRWERVRLRHRPDNPVDPNAVAVLRETDERQLGYLPATLAKDLVAAAREGTRYLAVVDEVSAPDPGDLIAVVSTRATLLVLALEGGATTATARRHLLELMNRR